MVAHRSLKELRLQLGDAAVLPVTEAAKLLPIRTDDALSWLREEGLVRVLSGREVVIWGDVLIRLRHSVVDTPAPVLASLKWG